MRFNPEEYETVDERIKRFYEDNPEGAIITDLKSDPADFGQCRYAAIVFRSASDAPHRPWATGYAYEVAGQSSRDGANFGSHEENCETSAIGRALANAGYSGAKRPSREEMNSAKGKQEKIADKPDDAETVRKRVSGEMKAFAHTKKVDMRDMQVAFRDHIHAQFSIDSKEANAHQLGSGWESFKKSYETPTDTENLID